MIKILYKYLLLFILFLVLGIISKSDLDYRNKIHYYLYEDNFAFSSFRNFYDKYLGDVFPLKFVKSDTVSVFSEDIKYSSINKYLDGFALKVSSNYLVPSINGGIVTYIGDKENYGNVIIVMGNDGVSVWYGNISNCSFKLYDSVDSGDIIGEVDGDSLYLVFNKGNEYLGYEDYLQ